MALDARARVTGLIDERREDVITFLKELVSIPSVTGEEAEIQAFVSRKLGAMGLEVDMWEPDLAALERHPAYVPTEMGYENRPNVVGVRWEGVSAIEKGYALVQAVSQLERIRIERVSHPLYPDGRASLPCMVGVFESGSFPSAFPDSCLLKGSIATLPGEDTARVKSDFADARDR